MNKRVLAVFSHPDDESFGPGGTLALWASQGAQIDLVCATKGEIGNNPTNGKTADIRTRELRNAADALGISDIHYLGYTDGHIGNHHIPDMAEQIAAHIQKFTPDTLMTFHLNGVSGHLDHIAVANATTLAFDRTQIAQKLYYYALPKTYTDTIEDYFIHFPDGFDMKDFNETIDITEAWDTKLKAMHCHETQKQDIEQILKSYKKGRGKTEYFMVREAKT